VKATPGLEVVEPLAAVAANRQRRAAFPRADLRSAGVQRWVDQRGSIRLAGLKYRVPIVLAGEPVEAVVADNLVQIYHRDVMVASHVQRHCRQHTATTPSGPTHPAGGHQRDRSDKGRRQQRRCVVRRDHV
jgi:hypothetical protein